MIIIILIFWSSLKKIVLLVCQNQVMCTAESSNFLTIDDFGKEMIYCCEGLTVYEVSDHCSTLLITLCRFGIFLQQI